MFLVLQGRVRQNNLFQTITTKAVKLNYNFFFYKTLDTYETASARNSNEYKQKNVIFNKITNNTLTIYR